MVWSPQSASSKLGTCGRRQYNERAPHNEPARNPAFRGNFDRLKYADGDENDGVQEVAGSNPVAPTEEVIASSAASSRFAVAVSAKPFGPGVPCLIRTVASGPSSFWWVGRLQFPSTRRLQPLTQILNHIGA